VPPAVKTWWYPGAKDGYEFIYPKEQARLLAKGTGEPVLTARSEDSSAVERITPAGAEVEVRPAAPLTLPPGRSLFGELAPLALPVPEPVLTARAELPKTASATGIAVLSAVGLLLAAAFVRRARVALG
jgi:hypothetical protein